MKRVLIAFIAGAVIFIAGAVFVRLNSRIDAVEITGGKSIEKYYLFDKLSAQREYMNGKLHGTTTTYFGNGEVKAVWSFRHGQRDGIAKRYGEDGVLRYEEYYEKGFKARRIEYDEAGNVVSDKSFTP